MYSYMQKFLWLAISVVAVSLLSGCALQSPLSDSDLTQQNTVSLVSTTQPDLIVRDMWYAKGKIFIEYCNQGTDHEGTVEIYTQVLNTGARHKIQKGVPYQIPASTQCIRTGGIVLQDFGLLFNTGLLYDMQVEIDPEYSVVEANEENNILVKQLVMAEENGLVIYESETTDITPTGVTVGWKTNRPATTECRIIRVVIDSGALSPTELSCEYVTKNKLDLSYSTDHILVFDKLEPGHTYVIFPRSVDAEGFIVEKDIDVVLPVR